MCREGNFKFSWKWLNYRTYERFEPAGLLDSHYFLQDIWAAKNVAAIKPARHYDVGSRIDGFVAHVLISIPVTYIDIRPLEVDIENLSFRKGSILELPFESGSIHCLSCLHVIEHIGLGRYGDPIDPAAYCKALRELSRVLAPGGTLLLGTPVGRERLCFDAHRVFAPETIIDALRDLRLQEFSVIPDGQMKILSKVSFEEVNRYEYACGLFEFKK
jgi:SAM-dependent methyltransferase